MSTQKLNTNIEELGETLIRQIDMLKTQRPLVSVGYSFVIASIEYNETKKNARPKLYISSTLCRLFGLKDRSLTCPGHPLAKKLKIIYTVILGICLLTSSSFPLFFDMTKKLISKATPYLLLKSLPLNPPGLFRTKEKIPFKIFGIKRDPVFKTSIKILQKFYTLHYL